MAKVAWRDFDNLVPVERGSFVISFDNGEVAHVAFTHRDTGERVEGGPDDVLGLIWYEDGEVRVRAFGRLVPPYRPL